MSESTSNLFHRLMAHHGGPSVSIYLPTHVKGRVVNQDPIRFRNQLTSAEALLEEMGLRRPQVEDLLEKARSLVGDREFWEHQGPGLGVFVWPTGEIDTVRLTRSVDEMAVAADEFHLRPLLAELDPPHVGVLVMTRAKVRLFDVGPVSVEPIEADLPASFEDVNWFVDREAQSQQHAGDRGASGQVHHGHDPQERAGADLHRFLVAIDDALPRGVEGGHPLLLLGVDDLTDRFATLTDRETVSPTHSGVEDADDLKRVRQLAQPLLERLEEERETKARDGAFSALGHGTGVTELAEALVDAATGRVESLVIGAGAGPQWGRFDPEGLEVAVRDRQTAGDVDLLDRLAAYSLRNGAVVTVLRQPLDGHPFVAIRRS